ncbi:MAG TPA: anti-sigma factor [Kofleriaceae bacterium]|jgi:hypothetical protein|nr:anti-sigma factor [Kofleriaceae bacterium]
MTTCDKTRPRLTAYLDGELADDHGSVVRGHLRECAACRQVARDEAALRDGLRLLPPVDPPASLWGGIQARLAAAEVADARRPLWLRVAERWIRWVRTARFAPTMPQLAAAGVFAAAAVTLLTLRAHRADEPPAPVPLPAPPEQIVRPAPSPSPSPSPGPRPALERTVEAPSADDVVADLLAEPARTTESYGRVVGELMTRAQTERARWSDADRSKFDTRVAELRGEIAHGGQPRSVQRTQRVLINYLQETLTHSRDNVMLASGGPQ